jgi:hypothetical protein
MDRRLEVLPVLGNSRRYDEIPVPDLRGKGDGANVGE